MVIDESVTIAAPIEQVWQTFIDLSCWADWNSILRDVSPESGSIDEGTSFRCSIRPFVFPVFFEPKIERIRPLASVTWVSRKFGITARHRFTFEQEEGAVRIRSHETFEGIIIGLGGWLMPRNRLRRMTVAFLTDLKQAAEKPS